MLNRIIFFDADGVVQFEGRTGPYILYTAVRLNSILQKGKEHIANNKTEICNLDEAERNLLLGILDFDRSVQAAFDKRATDIIANYAYDLCQLSNTFYHNCPILREDVNPALRARRLQIAAKGLSDSIHSD